MNFINIWELSLNFLKFTKKLEDPNAIYEIVAFNSVFTLKEVNKGIVVNLFNFFQTSKRFEKKPYIILSAGLGPSFDI